MTMPTKRCSSCKRDLSTDQFHKRKASPDGLAYRCADCVKRALVEWRAKNPDAFKVWASNNKEHRTRYQQTWYAENREAQPQRYATWAKSNPGKKNASMAKRRAAQLKATPPWADLNAVQRFYDEAARRSRETGIQHQVDHIIPLQGKNICGLHYAGNLQILTRSENARKRNSVPVGLL